MIHAIMIGNEIVPPSIMAIHIILCGYKNNNVMFTTSKLVVKVPINGLKLR